MSAKKIKELIFAAARDEGFHRASIGSLEPLSDAARSYEEWLDRGFAAGMEYLKRNPQLRTSPQLLYPGSRSAIIVAVSYYNQLPADVSFPRAGRVARYAVGLDYHAVIRARLRNLKTRIEAQLGRPLIAKAYTDDVALHEQSFASRHGIGFTGRNTMVIGPRLDGSYYFLAELFTDLELEADEPYEGTCGNCFRCGEACPTQAITADGHVDANLCTSYLTIENKAGIPLALRHSIGSWLFGCDVCQEVCPYNQRPPQTMWEEFKPEKGVGHAVDLCRILDIVDDTEFTKLFGHTPLRRPKRRGLLRNALVVAGNHLREISKKSAVSKRESFWSHDVTEKLQRLAKAEPDSMLREHAFWALTFSPFVPGSRLDQIVREERDFDAAKMMQEVLKHR
ncbi:MAG TPA: tRNA epoxyqueuosine(34) reductase QueG [Oculatellaceae cyanobacterium]